MASKALVAKKATKTAKAAPRSAFPEPVDAAISITELPSIELVAECIANRTKLYFDGEGREGSVLADTLNRAKTGSDLFAESELVKMADHLGETLTVLSIDGVNNSDEGNDGLGVWLVVSMSTQDGELIKMAVGAADAFAKIIALNEFGELPFPVAFERSTKKTRSGFYPINCVSRRQKDGSTF